MGFWKKLQLGLILAARWQTLYIIWKGGPGEKFPIRDRLEEVVKADPTLGPFIGELEAAFEDTKRLF